MCLDEQEQEQGSPVIGNASLPLGEVKLKKVTPKPAAAPPPKEEPSFENELLAKLKRRQVSIDQPAPPTTSETTQPSEIPETTPTVDTPTKPIDTPSEVVTAPVVS